MENVWLVVKLPRRVSRCRRASERSGVPHTAEKWRLRPRRLWLQGLAISPVPNAVAIYACEPVRAQAGQSERANMHTRQLSRRT